MFIAHTCHYLLSFSLYTSVGHGSGRLLLSDDEDVLAGVVRVSFMSGRNGIPTVATLVVAVGVSAAGLTGLDSKSGMLCMEFFFVIGNSGPGFTSDACFSDFLTITFGER